MCGLAGLLPFFSGPRVECWGWSSFLGRGPSLSIGSLRSAACTPTVAHLCLCASRGPYGNREYWPITLLDLGNSYHIQFKLIQGTQTKRVNRSPCTTLSENLQGSIISCQEETPPPIFSIVLANCSCVAIIKVASSAPLTQGVRFILKPPPVARLKRNNGWLLHKPPSGG